MPPRSGGWNDHFSIQAERYRRFRPTYPDELYAWLASRSPSRRLAWDCGTGNGQVARGLADRFERVVATDASLPQLGHAEGDPGIHFVAGRADVTPLRAGTVDTIAMGAALHWFAGDPFFAEVKRILRSGGLVAAWAYWPIDAGVEVTPIIRAFHRDVVLDYWPEGREHVENGYRTLPFPFAEIEVPEFVARARWSAEQLLGYIDTWSSVQRYREKTGEDPMPALAAEVSAAWGPDPVRDVRWLLNMRAGFGAK